MPWWKEAQEGRQLCSQGVVEGLCAIATPALGWAPCPAACGTGCDSSPGSWKTPADLKWEAACCTSCCPGVSAGGFLMF